LLVFFGLAVGGLFLTIVILGGLVKLNPELRQNAELLALPAQSILYLALYGALWLIIKVKYEHPLWKSLGLRPSRIPAWQAILGGCLLSFAVGLLGAALRTPQVKSPFDRFLHAYAWITVFGIFAILVGPLFEEVVFRGFVQPLLSRDLGNAAGVALTAAAFGLLHGPEYSGSWQYVVLIAFAGACFGLVRVIGRSLAPAIYMHAGFNAIFFVAALFRPPQ
jgi:uncharacterized protein